MLWARNVGDADKIVSIFSIESGLINLFAPRARGSAHASGLLLPGAVLQMNIKNMVNGRILIQMDGKLLTNSLLWSYEDVQRYTFFVRYMQILFPEGEKEVDVYHLLVNFFSLSLNRNVRILLNILCWQITSLAGYGPNVLLINGDVLSLSEKGRDLLKWMLKYRWEDVEYSISKKALEEVESAFICYVNRYIGCEFEGSIFDT